MAGNTKLVLVKMIIASLAHIGDIEAEPEYFVSQPKGGALLSERSNWRGIVKVNRMTREIHSFDNMTDCIKLGFLVDDSQRKIIVRAKKT